MSALPLLIFGSLGVSLSRTVRELFFFRVWQAVGASTGFSIGAGVIGYIYKMEERGAAMGIFLAVSRIQEHRLKRAFKPLVLNRQY